MVLQSERPSARPTDLVQSVSRALRILEEIGRADAPLTVKAIARRCSLHPSTAYHLVRTLSYEGYLSRLATGEYVIGTGVAKRFHDLVSSLQRPPQAHEVLQHLAAVTQRTAYLGLLTDAEIVVADLAEGPRSPYLEDLEVGLAAAAHATALGQVLLRTLPRVTRRRYLAGHGMAKFTTRTPRTIDDVESLLESQPGDVVIEHGQFRDGVSCAATVVPAQEPDSLRWALVVSTLSESMPDEVLVRLRLAASDLRRRDQSAGP